MTRRNRSLFLARGHAYIYLAYGNSYMLNVSSEMPGSGAGVLITALERLDDRGRRMFLLVAHPGEGRFI